jgi:hypothetical protein
VSHANRPGLTLPGHARRQGWRLLVLVIVLSVTFLAQCLAAEVPASLSSEPDEICACTCAPVSTLPPAPVALPVLAFDLPNQLLPLQGIDVSENVVLTLVTRRGWFTRAPPYSSLSLS